MTDIPHFYRPFQVWAYAVGHRQLLLRSVKSSDCTTRVDVLFKGVEALHLSPQIDALTIELASGERATEYAEVLGLRTATNIYVLSRDPLALVGAAEVFSHEDEGEYSDYCYFDVVAPPGLARPS